MSRVEAARRKAIGRWTVAGWIGWLVVFISFDCFMRANIYLLTMDSPVQTDLSQADIHD